MTRSTTPGSSSATTRRASRRSPTPTRRRRARTSTTWPMFAPGTYELLAQAPGYGFLLATGPSAGARTRRSSSSCRRTTRPRLGRDGSRRRDNGVPGPEPAPRQAGGHPAAVLNLYRRHRADALDGRGQHHRRQPLGGRQEGHDRPRRHGAGTIRHIQVSRCSSVIVATLRWRTRPEPLHGAAPVRGVGVQQRRGTHCSTSAGFGQRVHEPRGRLPGRPAAARGAAPDPARVRHPEHEGHPLAPRRKTSQCTGGPTSRVSRTQIRAHHRLRLERRPRGASRSFVRAAEFQAFSEDGERQPPLGD